MLSRVVVAALAAVVVSVSSVAKAQVPPEQWDVPAKLSLAQCVVAEAGWDNPTEWAVISHLLVRRWEAITSAPRTRHWTIERVVRQYCAMHRNRHPSPRQLWLRRLPWGPMTENPGFVANVDWRNYASYWDGAVKFVGEFVSKGVRDPLPVAMHFGGGMDGAPLNGVLLPRTVRGLDGRPARLHNLYYTISARTRRPARAPEPGTGGVVSARIAMGRNRR